MIHICICTFPVKRIMNPVLVPIWTCIKVDVLLGSACSRLVLLGVLQKSWLNVFSVKFQTCSTPTYPDSWEMIQVRPTNLGMGWRLPLPLQLPDASLVKPKQQTAWQGSKQLGSRVWTHHNNNRTAVIFRSWYDIMYTQCKIRNTSRWTMDWYYGMSTNLQKGKGWKLQFPMWGPLSHPGMQWGTLHVGCRGEWLQPNHLAGRKGGSTGWMANLNTELTWYNICIYIYLYIYEYFFWYIHIYRIYHVYLYT